MEKEIDTGNYQMVTIGKDGIIVLNPPIAPMNKEQALNFAAWLVAMADPVGNEFQAHLNAVLET